MQLFFEDIEPGRRVHSSWYRVTRDAIVEFGRAWDPYPFHTDEAAASKSFFGELVACTAHLFAIQSLLAHDLSEDVALISGLGGDGMQLIKPVRPDEELRLVRTYTGKRESRTNDDRGILGIAHTLERRDGDIVYRTSGSVLVRRRPPGLR